MTRKTPQIAATDAARLRDVARTQGFEQGVLVVAVDLEGADHSAQVLVDDVSVVVAGECFVDGVQNWPLAGAQVWTIKGVGGRTAKARGAR